MEEIPSWEANRFSATQEIPHILWKPKVHYLVQKCPPTVPNLNHLDPVQVSTSHFLKIYLNIIHPTIPGSSKWPLSLRFLYQNPLYASPLPIRARRPAQPALLNLITRTTLDEKYKTLSSSLCSFLRSSITSSILVWNINMLINLTAFFVHITVGTQLHLHATFYLCALYPCQAA